MEQPQRNPKSGQVLEQRVAFLDRILSSLPDLTFVWDREGRYLEYWAASPRLLYHPPEHFLGKLCTDVLPEDVAQLFLDALEQVSESGRTVTIEYSLTFPFGEV
ncbi:MAG: PAS domain-containing protein, partial [Bdellovibrionales bacterium]|nr:PAS domain-containing protein [Bdellovibrionales bacterium]